MQTQLDKGTTNTSYSTCIILSKPKNAKRSRRSDQSINPGGNTLKPPRSLQPSLSRIQTLISSSTNFFLALSSMEFWGVEVKAGQKLKVNPGSDTLLHLSQASLGESKKGKGNESVPLFLKVDDQKYVIGTLSAEKCNQITYDLVFEKEFELSHNWSNGSVYFCGYKSRHTEESDDDSSENESDSEEEEDIPLVFEENGIPEEKDVPSKPSTDNARAKVQVVEEDTDSDGDEDDSEDDDESESAKEMADSSDNEADDSSDDEDDDESSDEEDEATPNKAEQNKKRPAPAESDTKTPTGKKAKLVTPQKIGGEGKKTGGHIATPYPSKQAGKTSANKDKSKQQTPASDGQVTCGSCSKSFKSDQARDSHSKAKHGAAK